MLSIYIDPKMLDGGRNFPEMVAGYIDFVRACKPQPGVQSVMVPGDPERRQRKDRLANGIPLAVDGWNDIIRSAEALGVTRATIDEILERGEREDEWIGRWSSFPTPCIRTCSKRSSRASDDAVAAAVRDPEIHEKLVKFNQFPVGNTPEEFRAFLQTNAKNLQTIARDSRIKID